MGPRHVIGSALNEGGLTGAGVASSKPATAGRKARLPASMCHRSIALESRNLDTPALTPPFDEL